MKLRVVVLSILELIHASRVDAARVSRRNQSFVRSAHGMNSSNMCHFKSIERPVYLLVTNHGFSCGDIVNKFNTRGFLGRHSVQDPLLTAAGAKYSKEAAHWISEWATKNGFGDKVDAVLSSTLERTIQTAALQYVYPGDKVITFPFIKGRSRWYQGQNRWENRAKPLATQLEEVREALAKTPGSPKLSIDAALFNYNKEYGKDAHKAWDRFRVYLAHVLLPKIELELHKDDDRPIVVAVVTQPEFLNSGEVFDKCGDQYRVNPRSKRRKASRNQVLSIPYTFRTKVPDKDCLIVSHEYSLIEAQTEAKKCEVVYPGEWLYGENQTTPKDMCQKDIGDVCQEMETDKSFTFVIENQLQKKHNALEKLRMKVHKYSP